MTYVFEKMSLLTGKEPIVSRMNILSTITDRTFNIKRARNELKYKPAVNLQNGIKETILWFTENNLF